jgi:hypothetical protein
MVPESVWMSRVAISEASPTTAAKARHQEESRSVFCAISAVEAEPSGTSCVGRPKVSREIRELIRQMSVANPLWGAHGFMAKC